MTQPNPGGAPGAPTDTAPTATPPAPGAPAPVPAPGQDPNAPIDFSSLPSNVTAYIAQLRQEAGGHRQGKTAAEQVAVEAQQQRDAVLKALGLNADGTKVTDPEAAVNQLTQRASQAEGAAWGASVKLAVFQRAATLGADPSALLDSMSFVDSLDDLTDSDPDSPEFRAALEAKIAAALEANSTLRAKPAAPGRSGGDFSGAGGTSQAITEEQLAAMTPSEISKAYNEGKLKHLM